MLKRDVPLDEFETVKVLKKKEESEVTVVLHKPSNR
jgi:hypothetical protein